MELFIIDENGKKVEFVKTGEYTYLAYRDGKVINWTEVFKEHMERGQDGNATHC